MSPKRAPTRWLLALGLSLAVLAQPAAAQSLEARVKSAFLFNFARFVSFAPDKFARDDTPFDVCVLTPDPLEGALDETLRGKSVKGHAVRLRRSDRAEALRDCELVFIASRSAELLDAQLARLAGFGVLTVHEADSARSDGVVRLFLEDNRQRFEINLDAADRAALVLPAGLLDMARRVRQ